MSTAITSHDLFRIKLAQFKRELEEHAPDPHTEAGRQAPRQWQWYLEGDFRNFLRTMHENPSFHSSQTSSVRRGVQAVRRDAGVYVRRFVSAESVASNAQFVL
jgi:hypothetical protein